MPLTHSAPGTPGFSNNVKEMVEAGHPQKQAVAAAYQASGEKKGDAVGWDAQKDAATMGPVKGIADRVKLLDSRLDAAETRDLRRDAEKSDEPKYNAEAVNKAINSAYRGQKPPTGKQRSVTHALLKGWR